MKKFMLFALAFVFAFGTSALSAHDLWTAADKPEPGKALALVVGYGHDYPAPEAIDEKELPLFTIKLAGPEGDVPVAPGTPNYVWNSQSPVEAVTYLGLAEVAPSFLSKAPDGLVMKPKNEAPGAESCDRSTVSAKGVIVVGDGGDDSVVTKAQGLPMEIVPSANPAKAKVGEAISLTVLQDGKPVPAAQVTARYAGFEKLAGSSASAFSSPTDKDGKVNFVPSPPGSG